MAVGTHMVEWEKDVMRDRIRPLSEINAVGHFLEPHQSSPPRLCEYTWPLTVKVHAVDNGVEDGLRGLVAVRGSELPHALMVPLDERLQKE